MADVERADRIRGKTIRFIWSGGPTEGTTHEHRFHNDGTVDWRDTKTSRKDGEGSKERPQYAAVKLTDDVYLVSYLAESGYTLTVALNFWDYGIVGFASSAKEWHPLRGRFELA
jgi:hypothetical protein